MKPRRLASSYLFFVEMSCEAIENKKRNGRLNWKRRNRSYPLIAICAPWTKVCTESSPSTTGKSSQSIDDNSAVKAKPIST
jgi:hypothetical protein